MARLTVPTTFRPALAKLSSLSDESAAQLLSAINSSTPISNPRVMATRIGPSVPSISPEDLTQIVNALFSLSAVRVLHKVAIPSFVDDVGDSLQSKKSDVDVAALKSRLEKLLQADSLIVGAKASAIQREHPNVLVDARILTDLRPVFEDGPESLRGAVVVHMLKLTCIRTNEPAEFFFALDDGDLEILQKTIARAETKSKALRDFMEKSGLPSIDPIKE